MSLPKEMEYVDQTRLDSILGAALSVIRNELSECSYTRSFKQGTVTGPEELFFPAETIDPRYARLLFALLDPDVSRIERIDIPDNDEEREWLAKQDFKNTAADAYTGEAVNFS